MSKFVRIDRQINSENVVNNPENAVMLNLDLVATVKFSPMLKGELGKPSAANFEFFSADNLLLASFYLDTMEDGKQWVLQHLGIEL